MQSDFTSRITIPARRGKAAYLKQGKHIRVINTHGQQVIDTWAFNREDLSECMSMEHSRTALGRIMAHVGDVFVTSQRRPILRLVEDTSPGVHDTLLAVKSNLLRLLNGHRSDGNGAQGGGS